MRSANAFAAVFFLAAALFTLPSTGLAQAAVAGAQQLPADPWPRDLSIPSAAVLVYQPQVNNWTDNQLDFRAAVAIKPTGAKDETFGVIFATARTQVDKGTRTVVFENVKITKSDFPTLPNHGAGYAAELQTSLAKKLQHDLARPARSLDRGRRREAPPVPVKNDAAAGAGQHSPGDPGADRRRAGVEAGAGDSRSQRVINTRALILKGAWPSSSTCMSTTAG